MGQITRFEVMAVLQAARARALGFKMDEAKSWGLNRALFYAATKQAWEDAHAIGASQPIIGQYERSRYLHDRVFRVGTEKAFVSSSVASRLRFKFGDEVQTPTEFESRIRARFNDWEAAWGEATRIIRAAERRDLEIAGRFYKRIYVPLRDELAEKWSHVGTPRVA